MFINSLQKEPFTSLDIDLFQSSGYDLTTHDFIFSHVEKTDSFLDIKENKVTYPNYYKCDIFKEFDFIEIDNEASNVSILVVNDTTI